MKIILQQLRSFTLALGHASSGYNGPAARYTATRSMDEHDA
jgi:hypothetical protein